MVAFEVTQSDPRFDLVLKEYVPMIADTEQTRHDSVSPEESGVRRLHQEDDGGHVFVTQYRQAS